MKKLFFSIVLFSSTATLAQPVFNGITLPPIGTSWSLNVATVTERPQDGANVTWDYNSYTFTANDDVYEVVDINTIPSPDYIAAYPDCNIAIKVYNTSTPSNWNAYATKINSDTLYQGYPSNGTPSVPGIHPFFYFDATTYNSTVEDAGYNFIIAGYDSLKYSAYGTLKLGGKTYHNVAMIRGYMDIPYHTYRRTFWQTTPYFHLIAAYQEFPDNPSFPKTLTHYEVSNTVGISETELENTLSIYPNPATKTVTIGKLPNGTTVNITDITGKTMHCSVTDNEQITIHTSEYVSGVYIVHIESNGKVVNRKLVVNGH
jgi:hypothetical protein